jgi:NhaP-type Na+/H+ or K+/H+ antiporter
MADWGSSRWKLEDPILEIIATIALALVLFLDAVKLQIDELRSRWIIPVLVLGPGTALVISLGAGALIWLIGFPVTLAFIGGAVLASTDPVVLREVIRDPRIPRPIRQALRIEAGMNDLVVLPTILILIAVATSTGYGSVDWIEFVLKLIVLGPVVGFAIGCAGSWLIFRLDKQAPIRWELQSLYGIGLVLGSYAAGTAVGGDGFLAAFAAGLAVVLLNQTLCDRFLEYGETTSEMTMLLSFVLFGVVLSEVLPDAPFWPSIALAAILIFAVRPGSLGLVLSRARASWEARLFISWFGPRGLNSLLLALLAVHAGVPGAEELFAVVGIVVLASTVLHGASATPATAWYARRISGEVHEEERESDAAAIFGGHEEVIPRISVEELQQRLESPDPPLILDVRSRMSYEQDNGRIAGDIRVPPDRIAEWARTMPEGLSVVAYCT